MSDTHPHLLTRGTPVTLHDGTTLRLMHHTPDGEVVLSGTGEHEGEHHRIPREQWSEYVAQVGPTFSPTGRARLAAQHIAACRTFMAMPEGFANWLHPQFYSDPARSFDTGKQHGPIESRVTTPNGTGWLLRCEARDVYRVRLDSSHIQHPGYCYPLEDVAAISS